MFKKAKKNKKGFTLAELLIVVAIIAVLVAISIPIFTSQLEKSREAVDAANIRAAYAEVQSTYLTDQKSGTNNKVEVSLKQQQTGWQQTIDWPKDLATQSNKAELDKVAKGGKITVSCDENGAPTITFATGA